MEISIVTVYGDMLRARLADHDDRDAAVSELLAVVLATRATFEDSKEDDAASRLVAALAYDTAILRLCRALDLPTGIGGAGPPDQLRAEAEMTLTATLPGLSLEPL